MLNALALVTSLAAFAVSAVALYLASLRPADIEADHVDTASAIYAWRGYLYGRADGCRLSVAIYLWNAGAQGAVLDSIRLEAVEASSIWRSAETYPFTHSQADPGATPASFPVAFEAGDVETFFLVGWLKDTPGLSLEEYAAVVRSLDKVAGDLHWTFLRTTGLWDTWWIPKKWRRRRERVERTQPISISCDPFRLQLEDHWRTVPELAHLAPEQETV